jgi:hypothetical protein
MAGFSFLRILPVFQAEPVSSMLATTESCLSPNMDQAVCDELPPPWRNPASEKPWCRRSVRSMITDPWLAFPRPVLIAG